MDSKRLTLKAAVVTVPLSSHTYEIDIPLDFCFGNSELYCDMARHADSMVHSCSRWLPSINGCKCRSAALQHNSEGSWSASHLQYARHVPTARGSGEDGAEDEGFEARVRRLHHPGHSQPGRQGAGRGICLVGGSFARQLPMGKIQPNKSASSVQQHGHACKARS